MYTCAGIQWISSEWYDDDNNDDDNDDDDDDDEDHGCVTKISQWLEEKEKKTKLLGKP